MQDQVSSTFIPIINRCINSTNADDWLNFYNQFDKYIRRYIRNYFIKQRLVFNYNLLEDMVQEVYLKLLMEDKKALRAFVGSTDNSFLSYLSKIAQTIAGLYLRWHRASKRTATEISLQDAHVDDCIHPKNESHTQIEAQILQFEINKLMTKLFSGNNKDRDQQIFNLYLEGFTSNEIAQIKTLQMKPSTVETTLRRTKHRLQEHFYSAAA